MRPHLLLVSLPGPRLSKLHCSLCRSFVRCLRDWLVATALHNAAWPCSDCVIKTLEGPGISKSQCPDCQQPGWKKDLVFNHTINNLVEKARPLMAAAAGESLMSLPASEL
jgi:hypothetical protein